MAFMFEKLEVYQKAVLLPESVAALAQDFPRGLTIRGEPRARARSYCRFRFFCLARSLRLFSRRSLSRSWVIRAESSTIQSSASGVA